MNDHDETDGSIEQVGSEPASSAIPEAPSVRFRRRDSFLFNIRIPMWKYILRMALLSLVPSAALGIVLIAVGLLTEETAPQLRVSTPVDFVEIVIFSPFVETLILAVILWVLAFVTQSFIPRAIISAVIWGGIHSLSAPAHGLIVWWPFFVFSCSFLAWRRKSWNHAYLVAFCVHVLHNTPLAIVLALPG